jgi:DNA ligase 1
MKTKFKPQLCPNDQVDLTTLTYPMLASTKLDGIRAIFKGGELYSRSLKTLPNENLHEKFKHLKEFSKKHNVILDGELFCTSVPFNALSGIIRSDNQKLPDDLKFWCFDLLTDENGSFEERYRQYKTLWHLSDVVCCEQTLVFSAEDVTKMFDTALLRGYEGLILRNPHSKYKFGRATIKENIAYKVKPFQSFDSEITGVIQATEAREGSERTVDELGYSRTSKKKDDRVLIEKACAFEVVYEGTALHVSLAMTDLEKEEVWKNRKQYIGRIIEWKGMLVGSKDVPRHPVFLRFRGDKEDEN